MKMTSWLRQRMSKSQFKERGRADVGEVVRELGLAEGSIAIALPETP